MSMVFTPFYLPIVGLIALFIFSYMSLLPMTYKLVMLAMVYLLTVVAPSLLIHLYRLCQGWTSHELGKKERRIVPYIISILCYFICFFWMEYRNTPRVISIIVVVALAIQMVCAFINVWWKSAPTRQPSAVWQVRWFPTPSPSLSIPCGGSAWYCYWQAPWEPLA